MLRLLLAKDLLRAWRNPLPWAINLIVPLALTGLIGLVFGGKSDGGALGTIHFAVVNEDQPVLSDFLRGAANHGEGGKFLDPVFLERGEALRRINDDKLSAVLIIPTNFVRNYLTAREPVSLDLIKNPAESIHPAVLEELLGVTVTALNALARNFSSEFPKWRAVFEGDPDYHDVSLLIESAGKKFDSARKTIYPPLVSYEKLEGDDVANSQPAANPPVTGSAGKPASTIAKARAAKSGRSESNGVFAYLLIGMSAMFLLFLGSTAMTDLHRELRQRTFERYQTMHQQLWPFIVGKVVFAVVILLICSAVMLGGGGLIFRIQWQRPAQLIMLAFGYACFVAALFAVLVALVPDERRAGVLNNLAGMALGFVGGCVFPPEHLPAFLREYVTPLMPSHWFAETARSLQFDSGAAAWEFVFLKLAVAAVILVALATVLFRRRFKTGHRE
jgi:ABC-type multidrug transport system permease subunit